MTTFPTNLTDEDLYKRLASTLVNWFGNLQYSDQTIVNTLLQAYVTTAEISLTQLKFCFDQIYLATINDHQQLTLFARDFFYNSLPQIVDENDETYKKRIQVNLLAERCTRQAMIDRLKELTGFEPRIFEPWYPLDTGCYGGVDSTNYTMGYSTHGYYGSGSYPYQCFIDVYIPPDQTMGDYPVYFGESSTSPYPGIGAYLGESSGPPYSGMMFYGGDSLINTLINAAQVYSVINMTKMEGTVCWVRIHYTTPI